MTAERKDFVLSDEQVDALLDAKGRADLTRKWAGIASQLGFHPDTIAFVKGKTMHHFTAEVAPKTETY